MKPTSTTCGDHLTRKSWREADWDAVILHMVHKSLGPLGMIPQGAEGTQYHPVVSCGCDLVISSKFHKLLPYALLFGYAQAGTHFLQAKRPFAHVKHYTAFIWNSGNQIRFCNRYATLHSHVPKVCVLSVGAYKVLQETCLNQQIPTLGQSRLAAFKPPWATVMWQTEPKRTEMHELFRNINITLAKS